MATELEQWHRAAEIKQTWLDEIVDALGMECANSLEEILEQIRLLKSGDQGFWGRAAAYLQTKLDTVTEELAVKTRALEEIRRAVQRFSSRKTD